MADIFAEVDEAMRQERIMKVWHDHKVTLIVFVSAIILGTAATSIYRAWDTHVRTSQTEMVLSWLDSEDYPQNVLEQEKLDLRPALRGITLLNAAGKFMENDQAEQAHALYLRAANDGAIPAQTRDLATLMHIRLSTDTAPATQIPALMDIATNEKSPWRFHATLEAAILKAKSDDIAGAQDLLNTLQDQPDLPQSLYQKARALHEVYTHAQK